MFYLFKFHIILITYHPFPPPSSSHFHSFSKAQKITYPKQNFNFSSWDRTAILINILSYKL